MVACLEQGHLGGAAAESLGSKNTVKPKAFNSPGRVFIKRARKDCGRRCGAQAENSPGTVRAAVGSREPLHAKNCHQYADEQKLAPRVHMSKKFSPHSKARRIQFIHNALIIFVQMMSRRKVDNNAC